MRIPYINSQKRERTEIKSFLGYDKREEASKSSFSLMKNMSSHMYPIASTRKKRGILDMGEYEVYDIFTLDIFYAGKNKKNVLVADCSDRLRAYIEKDGEYRWRDLAITSSLSRGEKMDVVCATALHLFPDKIRYDFMNHTGVDQLECHNKYPLGIIDGDCYELVFEPCDMDGEDADSISPYRRIRKRYYRTDANGVKQGEALFMAFNKDFFKGDTISITGLSESKANGFYNIVNIPADRVSLIVESDSEFVQTEGNISFDRSVPDMDFVISAGNRLWGCRYGLSSTGECVNEIYASALGDGRNWHKFQGISTDSWAATVGCAGAFTGAVCMNGYPVFFKEDAIIKVFGDIPSEFVVSESVHRGVEAGSYKSIAFVNDDLYYKTHSGIVRYDGGVPVNVDKALGVEKYKNAVGGSLGGKYYVSMEDEKGKRSLFVYDSEKRLWHIEDNKDITAFARCGGELWFLYKENGKSMIANTCENALCEREKILEWYCESSELNDRGPYRESFSSLCLRLEGERGGFVRILCQYDKDGIWRRLADIKCNGEAEAVRLRPRRCHSLRLRLEGRGECRLISLSQTSQKTQ